MIRLRVLSAVALVALGPFVTSCGSGGEQVDNDSCPGVPAADGSSPYYNEVNTNGNPVGQLIPQMPHTHVAPPTKVTYEHNPPTSGCHYSLSSPNPAPIPAGVYTQHIDPEHWVHNLEHGYIVVVYNCPQGCASDFQALRTWAAKQKPDPGLAALQQQNPSFVAYSKVLVIPWSFDHKFAVLSWDYYDPMDSLDTGELQRFYDNHVGQSPESITSQ